MLEYDNYNEENTNSSSGSQESTNTKAEGKASTMGFTSSEQERMWMDQVRRECVRGYTNRMR